MDIKKILKKLSIEEKIALVSGTNFMYTNPIKRLGVRSIRMSDGPHGLRVQKEGGDNGVTGSEPSTCFPTAATLASSFNPSNAFKMGEAIGKEALYYGIDIVLGPGICIKRNSLCGRNFEYFSEDPLLAGKMGASEISGIQKNNVGSSVKHFALNNQENYRFLGNSICDDRAIREIYLKPFEIAVKESKPDTVMCAYNKINDEYCTENHWLLNTVLRKEWNFKGLVMSDWGATHNRVKGIQSGLDLEMPGDTAICRKWIFDSIKDGTLKEGELDESVKNILTLVSKYENNVKLKNIDWEEHNNLAKEIALDSAVLLKNEGALPLNKDDTILVVGDLFTKMRYQGSGSSMINPTMLCTPKEAFDRNNVIYEYCKGYSDNATSPEYDLINEAITLSDKYKKVLVFIGLTDYIESEGCDRDSMQLPDNQIELINKLAERGKDIVLVTFGGSPFELPFKDKVNAILNMYLPGQCGGLATYELLFGIKSPCGKLAETWVKNYKDVPFSTDYSKSEFELYKESIFVGYRYFQSANIEVNYPFGYGLTYTKFQYSNINLTKDNDKYVITFDLENIGDFDSAEIVQLYVKAPQGIVKPTKELRGFNKVLLKKGEKKNVSIELLIEDLRYWNTSLGKWVLEDGNYDFEISSSSSKPELVISDYIKGETLPSCYDKEVEDIYKNLSFDLITDKVFERLIGREITKTKAKKITIESRFSDLKQSKLLGRIIYKAVINVAKKQMKEAKKLKDGIEKENKLKGAIFLERILNSNSIDTMTMCGSNSMPYNFAEGFVHFANGELIKGIKCFTTKIEAPILPKDKEIKK